MGQMSATTVTNNFLILTTIQNIFPCRAEHWPDGNASWTALNQRRHVLLLQCQTVAQLQILWSAQVRRREAMVGTRAPSLILGKDCKGA